MTTIEMKSLPRGSRVLRTYDFNVKREKPIVYMKVMDGSGITSCVFHLVKPNGTIVHRDQYLHAKEIELEKV